MKVRPLMSYSKDERDFHKHGWKLPIPAFDEYLAAPRAGEAGWKGRGRSLFDEVP